MEQRMKIGHVARSLAASKQKSIWDITHAQHCSIVGTCLTLSEARLIGKKINVTCLNKEDLDATIHSVLVQECKTKNWTSRLINKTLNKKFDNSIRIFKSCKNSEELLVLWREAFSVGNIPGPYWAVLSHPCLSKEAGVKVYSDVHMLSHLVGSSNQANIVRITELEIELANAHDKIKKLIINNNTKVRSKINLINAQEEKLHALKRINDNLEDRLAYLSQSIETDVNMAFSNGVMLSGEKLSEESGVNLSDVKKAKKIVSKMTSKVEEITIENVRLRTEVEEKDSQIDLLNTEMSSIELMLENIQARGLAGSKSCDLAGKCVLYIGGRSGTMCRMCDIVKKMNGNLVHHDGGREDSLASLPSAVSSADAVLFPTNCVSHSSALEAKKLCKRMAKPYLPIRSSGLGSLINGLVEINDRLDKNSS
jgi:hypothetical protein